MSGRSKSVFVPKGDALAQILGVLGIIMGATALGLVIWSLVDNSNQKNQIQTIDRELMNVTNSDAFQNLENQVALVEVKSMDNMNGLMTLDNRVTTLDDRVITLESVNLTSSEDFQMLKSRVDMLEMDFETVMKAVQDMLYLMSGQMWTSELKTGVYSISGADRQVYPSTGFILYDARSRFRFHDFYGAAPMWNVSINVPFVTTTFVNSPIWYEPTIVANGIMLENGTYSVTVDVEGTIFEPVGRFTSCQAWFVTVPLSEMTTVTPSAGTVDFMSNAMASDDLTNTHLWGGRIAQHNWIVASNGIDRFSAMSSGVFTVPPEGAHFHYMVFWNYLQFYGTVSFDKFNVHIAKFE